MTTATQPKKTTVPPFSIEIDHPKNGYVAIQSIPGVVKLRGMIKSGRLIKDQGSRKTGEMLPLGGENVTSRLPDVPGQVIRVTPSKLEVEITDPLNDDPDLCDRIRRRINSDVPGSKIRELKGQPDRTHTIDKHRMKTLCRELIWLMDAGYGVVRKGVMPDLENVEKMDGEFLKNPGSQVRTGQPRFEKDYEEWVDRLTRSGL